MELRLQLRRKSEDVLVLGFPIWVRIVFGAIALIPLYGLVNDGVLYIVPTLLLFVCVLAALYNETWIFDRARRIIEYRFGLLVLFKRRVFPFDDVASLELDEFVKGSIGGALSGPRPAGADGPSGSPAESEEHSERRAGFLRRRRMTSLTLVLKDDTRVRIETQSKRVSSSTPSDGDAAYHDRISSFCDIPLTKA